MKMSLNFITSLLVGSLLQAVTISYACADLSGAYVGFTGDKNKKVDLFLHSLEDQHGEGSYLALIVEENPLVVGIYKANPTSQENEKLELIPYQVTPFDGSFGINNPDPTLIIEFGASKDHVPVLSAHSSNHFGIQGGITLLPNDHPDMEWEDLRSGEYHQVKGPNKITVPDANAFSDGQAEVDLLLDKDRDGTFIFRNSPPWIFTLRAERTLSDYTGYEKYLSGIVVFVRHGNEEDLLLVNPQSPDDVTKFKRK
jgi:hypothetical protein